MRRPASGPILTILAAAVATGACGASAADPHLDVAVAANFVSVAQELADRFRERTGTEVRLAVGSTGGLAAQITAGAPYHVLLAADTLRPAWLEQEGAAVAGSRFTYALGRLAVHAPGREDSWALPDLLREPGLRIAWADPRTAPYGAAARAALEAWGLGDLEGAVGESVGQTWQFVRSGAVDAAFVALAQTADVPAATVRLVPDSLYPPIRQDAVLLEPGAHVEAAAAFLEFLTSDDARTRIQRAGYALPAGSPHGG